MNEFVILVDEMDREMGTMEKMAAHRQGLLHRAFSVVLFNSKGELLMQKRAAGKYHSAGLWTNTCCSHPRPHESIETAARRRLVEEMGIDIKTNFAFKFNYKAELDNNLTENECDHILVGTFDGTPVVNPAEVADWKFEGLDSIRLRIKKNPETFTHWFRLLVHHPEFEKVGVLTNARA
ncbi:MAG: isopentenyl-diphosphate Delta-isomerase [Bacteroidetes bacterium]|nr:isopentenyl-diphosphate Delta-isomerase [Bacteroidota bacterium]